MKLYPKHYHFIKQIAPFVCIWVLFGFIYVIVEFGILGRHPIYPSTGNRYSFRSSLLYTLPSTLIMGIIQGLLEIFWFKKALQKTVVWKKILLKSIFYILLIMVFLIVLTAINSALTYNQGNLNDAVLKDIDNFVNSFAFWSVVIYIGSAIILTLFISEVNDYLGNTIFSNFLFGKYHKPIKEERIFMFLDMKSSTTIAERIGHQTYFEFIGDYYADMTDAILETEGEIYQYVGDEIVVTWPRDKGVLNNNCIVCFYKIKKAIEQHETYFLDKYGIIPEFKAGLHIGQVTAGEIGILKKEIIYSGDVLNTTARIQSMCNTFNVAILISESLKKELDLSINYKTVAVDKIRLRGKKEMINLYTI